MCVCDELLCVVIIGRVYSSRIRVGESSEGVSGNSKTKERVENRMEDTTILLKTKTKKKENENCQVSTKLNDDN